MAAKNDSPLDSGYREAYAEFGESPRALQWINYRSAAVRYRELVADLDINGKSVLDAGCGMGDILPFLYAKSDTFNYTGIDINPEFIDIASKRYTGHKFRVGDAFKEDLKERYDIVLLSGVMNLNTPGWLKQRKKIITQLFDLAQEATAFNMAGGFEPVPHDSLVAYAKATDILDHCSKLTKRLILKTHYHSSDFTIVLFK